MNSREKRQAFEIFYKKSKPYFRYIHAQDKSIQYLSHHYGFCICPGSSDGGFNKRIVEIFWGSRPFDKVTEVSGLSMTEKFIAERGAGLTYQLLDNGNVVISLSPAKTDYLSPIEGHIFITLLRKPKKLLNIRYLKKHWKYVKAYMNITSLEGSKSIQYKVITWYLRNFKNTLVNKKLNGPKAISTMKEIIKYVITVGLSGFLLLLISSIKECNNNEIEKNYEEKVMESILEIKEIQHNIKDELNAIRTQTINNIEEIDNTNKQFEKGRFDEY
jgi:hypothetical protein